MRLTHRLGVAFVLLATAGALVGAGGFSETAVDRDASVAIVEDGDAYVGLIYDEKITVDVTDANGEVGPTDPSFDATAENVSTVNNQFTVGFDFTLETEQDDDSPEVEFVYDDDASSGGTTKRGDTVHVPVGERAVFDAEVTCEVAQNDGTTSAAGSSTTVTTTYDVTGEGVSATVTREVEVECNGAPTTTATTPTPIPTSSGGE